MHTNSHVHGTYMMITSSATVILTLQVQMAQLLQLILNNYTVKTDLYKLSHFYRFFFSMHCYGGCQHLQLFTGRCMMLMVGLTCRELLAHLKLFFCLLTVHLLVLSSLASKFYVMSKFCGVWYVLHMLDTHPLLPLLSLIPAHKVAFL